MTAGTYPLPRILRGMMVILLTACAPHASNGTALLHVNSSSAASPWLDTAYACTPTGAEIVLGSPDDADLLLRLAEPMPLTGPAFQIGVDDVLVVAHAQVGVGSLSAAQVEAVFAGQLRNWGEVGGPDLAIQVWVFAPTVDVQEYFDRVILHGRPASSLARLAVSAQHMSDSVGSSPGSIGLLPRRWKTGNTRELLIVGSVPVLALTNSTPQGQLAALVECMQAQE